MKVILFVALIISGIMSAGSEPSERSATEPDTIRLETEFAQTVSTNETIGLQAGQMAETAEPVDQEPIPVAEPTDQEIVRVAESADQETVQVSDQESVKPSDRGENEPILLRSVQELTLYDDRAAVIGKLGEPRGVTQDEFYRELVIFEYEQLRVVFFGEFIQSVDIPGDVGEILLDDVLVPATISDLKEALGEPDYVAEDGIVFQRDEALLKLFIDGATGELDYISYYHLATV